MPIESVVSLQKIQGNLIAIKAGLKQVHFQLSFCKELHFVKFEAQTKIIQAATYLIHLQQQIQEKHPTFQFTHHNFSNLEHDFLETDVQFNTIHNLALEEVEPIQYYDIQHINSEIYKITVLLDRCAIDCKFCPELGMRPYVKTIALAMCELIELQKFYIYPLKPDLKQNK